MTPRLFIFAGLPGSGKSTLAAGLARHLGAVFLRIDTVEQALRDLCSVEVGGEGYRLCYRIAAENLANRTDVVADSCNPWELTRDEWEQVAIEANVDFVNIEVVCSDAAEHRQRVETRATAVRGLVLPTWEEVVARDYHPWTRDRIVVDTAGRTPEACLHELVSSIEA